MPSYSIYQDGAVWLSVAFSLREAFQYAMAVSCGHLVMVRNDLTKQYVYVMNGRVL
jgi:hypothetical protein